ncbi:MAG: hypothetical protein ACJ8LM_01155 [Candidatus Udaeobacter sp.]
MLTTGAYHARNAVGGTEVSGLGTCLPPGWQDDRGTGVRAAQVLAELYQAISVEYLGSERLE